MTTEIPFASFSALELSFSDTLKTHYGLGPLKGPLTASILDTFRRSFGDSVHPPHPPRSMLSREDAADPH